MKTRQALLAVYGSLYQHHFSEQGLCFYCADPADGKDHVPPVSWIESQQMEDWREQKIPFVTVNCCRACNAALGSRPLFTTQERTAFLLDKLNTLFDRRFVIWTDEELSELGHSLQGSARARMFETNHLAQRIRALQLRLIHEDTHP